MSAKAAEGPSVDVLLFCAKWAPASLLMLEKLKAESGAGVRVEAVDVDSSFAQAEEWRVLSIPTAVVVLEGEERKRLSGVATAEAVSHAKKVLARAQARGKKKR